MLSTTTLLPAEKRKELIQLEIFTFTQILKRNRFTR